MFSPKNMLIVALAAVAVWAVVVLFKQYYTVSKKTVVGTENFDPEVKGVQPSYEEVSQNAVPQSVPRQAPGAAGENDRLTSKDLLPSGAVEANWSSVVQVPKPNDLVTNYIDSSSGVGIISTNSTLKNASLDLRPEPQVQKTKVSPFLNSSYEMLDPKFNKGFGEIDAVDY